MWRRERIIGLILIYVADIWSGTCQFRIFVSGLISVEDTDAPNWSPGVGIPCGNMGLNRDLVYK